MTKSISSIALLVIALTCHLPAAAQAPDTRPLPRLQAPDGNPASEEKRILGKILFWDEQLSSDDTVACGSCHLPGSGGGDPRQGVNPGPDHVFGSADDVIGSIGIALYDEDMTPLAHPDFGYSPQVTGRAAPSFLTGVFADELFWDGRAGDALVDPVSGDVVIAAGAALETQALGPILSSAEMAKSGRTWDDVVGKLERVTPLALAADLPDDVVNALDEVDDYPGLFALAFGDGAITPVRTALAIATYERSLVPDRTPFDRFAAGNTGALTGDQQAGLTLFRQSVCNRCHGGPEFTNQAFATIGLRPPTEDIGRQAVTDNARDLGAFRVPSLRNVGLRATLMHNGRITDVQDAIDFYNAGTADTGHRIFTQNLTVTRNEGFPDIRIDEISFLTDDPAGQEQVVDFLSNGLTDPRAAAETYPFDRPVLAQEQDLGFASVASRYLDFGNDAGAMRESPVFQVRFTTKAGWSDKRDFNPGELVQIDARLDVAGADVGEGGDLYVIVRVDRRLYCVTADGAFTSWDARLETLAPFAGRESLGRQEAIPLTATQLGAGDYALYVGYATDAGLTFNPRAVRFGISR